MTRAKSIYLKLFFLLWLSITAYSLEVQIDVASERKIKGEPFYIRFVVTLSPQDSTPDSTGVSISLDSENVFQGDFTQFGEMVTKADKTLQIKPLQQLEFVEEQRNDQTIQGYFLVSGVREGFHFINFVVSQKGETILKKKISLNILSNTVFENELQKRWFSKKTPQHFSFLYLTEKEVFFNQQYFFTMYAAKNINEPDELRLTGFFYYNPLQSDARSLSYEMYTVHTLREETFILKGSDVTVNPSQFLNANTKMKIFYPYLEWEKPNKEIVKDLSYDDEFLEMQIVQPPEKGGFYAEEIRIESWNITPQLKIGEIGELSVSLKTRSSLTSPVFKILTAPGTGTILEYRETNITERAQYRSYEYVYRYQFEVIPVKEGTYTFSLQPFEYYDPKAAVRKVLEATPVQLSVTGTETISVFTGVVNPLKDLRQTARKSKDTNLYEEGIRKAKEGDTQNAISIFESLLKSDHLAADVLYNLGWLSYYAKDFAKAQLYFYRSALLRPEDDVKFNIRYIESTVGLRGQPIQKTTLISKNIHIFYFIIAIVMVSPGYVVFFFRVLKKRFGKSKGRLRPLKRSMKALYYSLTVLGIVFFVIFIAEEIVDHTQTRFAIVQYSGTLYSGPSFHYPTMGSVNEGDVGKYYRQENGFYYVEYTQTGLTEETASRGLLPTLGFWIPTENAEIVLDTIFY